MSIEFESLSMKRQIRYVIRPNAAEKIPGVDDESTIDTADEQEYNEETSEITDETRLSDTGFVSNSPHKERYSQDSFEEATSTSSVQLPSTSSDISDSSDVVFIGNPPKTHKAQSDVVCMNPPSKQVFESDSDVVCLDDLKPRPRSPTGWIHPTNEPKSKNEVRAFLENIKIQNQQKKKVVRFDFGTGKVFTSNRDPNEPFCGHLFSVIPLFHDLN